MPDPALGTPADPPPDASTGSTPGTEATTGQSEGVDELPAPPEITTATQSDDGNLDVSVRVDSPGTEGPVTQEGAEEDTPPDVVSPPVGAGITDESETGRFDTGDSAPLSPDPAADTSQSGATNTNVSVRVLSPGDNGAVNQTNASTPAGGGPETDEATNQGDPAGEASESPPGSEQYHDPNSQYQSVDNTSAQSSTTDDTEPWNWEWSLTICDGNSTSISSETGSPESKDWIWNWIWNWSCDAQDSSGSAPSAAPATRSSGDSTEQARGSGVPQAGPANVNVSIRVLSPGDDGPVNQTNTSPAPPLTDDAGSSEPTWFWVWTFTWCGETTEITTSGGAGTGLDWLWNWTWNWACGEDGSGDTGGGSAPANPDPTPRPAQPRPQASDAPASGGGATDASVASAATPPATDVESLLALSFEAMTGELSAWPLVQVPFAPVFGESAAISTWPPSPTAPWVDVSIDVAVPKVVVKPAPPLSPALSTLVISSPGGTVEITVAIGTATPAPSSPSATGSKTTRQRHAPGPDAFGRRSAGARSPETSTLVWKQAPASPPSAQRSQPTASAVAGASSGGPAHGPLPFDFPPLEATSSSASVGGSAPGLLLFGFAALIGFFVLAAPGLGRRIRLARLPSPRGRHGSSIDDPG